MSKKITIGQRERIEFKDRNLRGLQINVFAKGDTDNQAIDVDDLDFDDVVIDINLYQQGENHRIYSGTLGLLATESAYLDDAWNYVGLLSGRQSVQLLAEAAATVPIHLVPVFIDFGTVINLDGSDMLTVDLRVADAFITGNDYIDPDTSYLEVSGVDAIGVQHTIPEITVEAIQGAEPSWTKSLGDNVMSVLFINLDKVSELSANAIIDVARIKSDRLNISESQEQLLSRRLRQFPEYADAASRGQSFLLVDKELDNCTIDLTLDSANVASGKNYVVWRKYKVYRKLLAKAEAMENKHIAHAVNKVA